MVVSDDMHTLRSLNSLSNKYDIDLLATMYGNDCIQRIKDNESFDLIILEDDMKPLSAFAILGKLQEIKKDLKTPIVVMLKKDKEGISKHYIEDGFDNYLLKENLDSEFDRIIKKYI